MRICAITLSITMASVGGGFVANAAPPPAPTTLTVPGAHPARPATAAEVNSYTRREKKASAALAKFAGGDVVVITASTLVIVLLVVLIVLLVR
jgi:hypothetical protein